MHNMLDRQFALGTHLYSSNIHLFLVLDRIIVYAATSQHNMSSLQFHVPTLIHTLYYQPVFLFLLSCHIFCCCLTFFTIYLCRRARDRDKYWTRQKPKYCMGAGKQVTRERAAYPHHTEWRGRPRWWPEPCSWWFDAAWCNGGHPPKSRWADQVARRACQLPEPIHRAGQGNWVREHRRYDLMHETQPHRPPLED